MGFLDFLLAGAVINSAKKARRNSSQPTHGCKSDYYHGYDNCDAQSLSNEAW